MLLVLDVGNTHTVVGLFDNTRLVHDWRIHTEPRLTDDELNLMISRFFRQAGVDTSRVRQTVVSSVVPPLANAIESFCVKYLGHTPDWISHKTVDMPVLLANPAEVGADRLVNAIAAYEKYQCALIIIDFGTATTFDCVSEKGEYLGGAISPGIGISAEALFVKASKLPRVELIDIPERAIGKDTSSSMRSGLLYGYADLVDGMVRRIGREMDTPPRIIATGGLSSIIYKVSETIESLEPDLTLEGLHLLAGRIRTTYPSHP
jgi:type III pantothenate kinase